MFNSGKALGPIGCRDLWGLQQRSGACVATARLQPFDSQPHSQHGGKDWGLAARTHAPAHSWNTMKTTTAVPKASKISNTCSADRSALY